MGRDGCEDGKSPTDVTERPIEPCPCHFASPIRASFLVTSFRLVVISSLPTVPSSFTPSRHFVPPPAARMDGVSERVNERQTDAGRK